MWQSPPACARALARRSQRLATLASRVACALISRDGVQDARPARGCAETACRCRSAVASSARCSRSCSFAPTRSSRRIALIDELWGERPPPSAAHTLQVYVSRLRSAFRQSGGDEGDLVTRPPGYVLRVGFGELDLQRFEHLAEEGRRALASDSPERAAERLREALALWRGDPLADLAFEPFARIDVERLEELRLAALEDRIDADLALGRHTALVPETERLVAQYPLRERLRGQLMLALYRAGRQADALTAYRETRELPRRRARAGAQARSCATSSRRCCARTSRSSSRRPLQRRLRS